MPVGQFLGVLACAGGGEGGGGMHACSYHGILCHRSSELMVSCGWPGFNESFPYLPLDPRGHHCSFSPSLSSMFYDSNVCTHIHYSTKQ